MAFGRPETPRDIEGQFVRILAEGEWVTGDAVLMTLANRVGKGMDESSAVSAARLMIDRGLAIGFIERREDGRIRLLPLTQRNEVRSRFQYPKIAPTMVTLEDKTTGQVFTCELGSDRERELRQQIQENQDAAFYAGFERAKRAYEKKTGKGRQQQHS